ncbi:unnamed protein product [Coregonus sp. 'balchen']|nr:unnamed protein product [Coregonus sp. 'balchen']
MVCQDLFVFFCSTINQTHSTKAQRSSGYVDFGTFPSYMELDIWVPPNDTESSKESFRLQYLKPDTKHVVQVRCMHHTGYGYWSDWSANTTAKTPMDKPPPVASLSSFTQDGRLWVEWQPPNLGATGVTEYVLEWVSVSDGAMDWQREPRHNRKAPIKGKNETHAMF